MKVEVVRSTRDRSEFTVELKQGVQSFRLDYSAGKEEAEWMADMFKTALKAHDEARDKSRK